LYYAAAELDYATLKYLYLKLLIIIN
jgi:hypothetical protein